MQLFYSSNLFEMTFSFPKGPINETNDGEGRSKDKMCKKCAQSLCNGLNASGIMGER